MFAVWLFDDRSCIGPMVWKSAVSRVGMRFVGRLDERWFLDAKDYECEGHANL
ncbi:hypothetical protein RRSWK_00491 [Rhodopirellula sp. SWK7]|nr:hypothetical protein RRSWK_00491 [Rhodopirellula sp. SWK7]